MGTSSSQVIDLPNATVEWLCVTFPSDGFCKNVKWSFILTTVILGTILIFCIFMTVNSARPAILTGSKTLKASTRYWILVFFSLVLKTYPPYFSTSFNVNLPFFYPMWNFAFNMVAQLTVSFQANRLLRFVENKMWIFCLILLIGCILWFLFILSYSVYLVKTQEQFLTRIFKTRARIDFYQTHLPLVREFNRITEFLSIIVPIICFSLPFYFDRVVPTLLSAHVLNYLHVMILLLILVSPIEIFICEFGIINRDFLTFIALKGNFQHFKKKSIPLLNLSEAFVGVINNCIMGFTLYFLNSNQVISQFELKNNDDDAEELETIHKNIMKEYCSV